MICYWRVEFNIAQSVKQDNATSTWQFKNKKPLRSLRLGEIKNPGLQNTSMYSAHRASHGLFKFESNRI